MNRNQQNVLTLIPEFGNKKLLLKYFVAYENREAQQNLFNFWLYVIDTLSKNFYHSSILNTLGFKSLFTQFQSYPICLDNILLQMQQQNLIIFVNNQWDDILVDIVQGQQKKQNKDSGIIRYWKKIIGLFYQQEKNDDYQETQNFIIIQQFKQNYEIIKNILEHQQIKLSNNLATVQELHQQTQISEFEINIIFKVLIKSGQVEKLGKLQQDHFIWNNKHNQHDQANYERRKVIFTLKCIILILIEHDHNLSEEINEKDYKLFHVNEKLRLDPSIMKLNEKKLIESQLKQLENKQVIINRLISSLEQAISDNQIQKVISIYLLILGEVNIILRKYQIDNESLRNNLEYFQGQQIRQQKNNDMYKTNRDEDYENEMIKYYQNK